MPGGEQFFKPKLGKIEEAPKPSIDEDEELGRAGEINFYYEF